MSARFFSDFNLRVSTVASLSFGLLVLPGCGDDAVGNLESSTGTTSGQETVDDTGTTTGTLPGTTSAESDSTTSPADGTGSDDSDGTTTDSTGSDSATTEGSTTGPDECDCEEGRLCDRRTQTCVGCLDESDCAVGEYCDPDSQECVTGCWDSDGCDDPTPHCDQGAHVCVACLLDEHCDGAVCDPDTLSCVGCLDDADCADPTPLCDLAENTCVGCTTDADCDDPTPVCDERTASCVGCTTDDDCDAAEPLCNGATNTCVACLVDADCANGDCCLQNTNSCQPCPDGDAYLMMPDSTNDVLVLFNSEDGALVNGNYFALAGGTPVRALQVENEIWVSEQIGDRVSRWSSTGQFLGQIGGQVPGGGLDNIRGIERIGDLVYVTNSGANNDAPGNAVVVFDLTGTWVSQFSTVGFAPSPFAVLPYGNDELLVSSSSANDDVHRFTLAGLSLGTFHNSNALNFAQQMNYAHNGDILVAGFSSNTVVRLDPVTGDVISSFAASGARGVVQLDNGNILWTNSAGAHVFDPDVGTSTLVYAGQGRHVGHLQL